ncbi:DUF7002 family protein [Roseomonas elaeocarpi]|uniref:DUF7002 family protein n=1 Tax=Roseomonas elaeocarpi TaxID=907779 RepID=A0ABV6JWA8_9PROT
MEAFTRRYPRLFHVTDPAALPGIEADGLLSAEALLRLYAVPDREAILGRNRGRGNFQVLERAGHPGAVLRDQWMPDEPLRACLGGRYRDRPEAWRRLINAHVFFWVEEAQARRLAGVNRAREQRVLVFGSAALLAGCDIGDVFTTPINAGYALPRYGRPPSPRDETTFRPLAGYPYRDAPDRRPPRELAVRGGVAGAMRFRVT